MNAATQPARQKIDSNNKEMPREDIKSAATENLSQKTRPFHSSMGIDSV